MIALAQYPFKNGVFPEIKHERKGHFYLIKHLKTVFGKNSITWRGEPAIINDVMSHMKNWGFNCGGYGTGAKLINEGVYYLGNLNLVKHGFYHLDKVKFPDVFDESFEKHVNETIKKTAKAYYNPEQLIGVVWSDLPAWNIYKSRMLRQTDWVSEIRKLEKTAPGKKMYLSFLKKKYENDTEKLKEYYRLSGDDLDNLEDHDFSSLYLGHPMVMKDDELFMVEIARRYYKLGAKYHANYFPNTLLFGDRFLLGDHPDAILNVA